MKSGNSRRTIRGLAFAACCQLVLSTGAQAQSSSVATRGPYDLSQLRGICSFVYDRARQPAGSVYYYSFQKMMADAAGAQPDDDVDARRIRVRYLWLDNQHAFRCTAQNFNLSNGNLLKYSVRSRSFEFIVAAIEDWHLELNFIDLADHRTILDYVAREAEANDGNSDSATINSYLDALREVGAKHCFEVVDPKYCAHPNAATFLGRDFSLSEADSASAEREISEYNERVRTAPVRPYRPL
ncbi:MAG: hypothetical protein EON59_01415 [Alphaproteobacteria bacterium]|nr:MAG: hypothetical protein EON59_01415 [Alphaproteobacteria bacterium]